MQVILSLFNSKWKRPQQKQFESVAKNYAILNHLGYRLGYVSECVENTFRYIQIDISLDNENKVTAITSVVTMLNTGFIHHYNVYEVQYLIDGEYHSLVKIGDIYKA